MATNNETDEPLDRFGDNEKYGKVNKGKLTTSSVLSLFTREDGRWLGRKTDKDEIGNWRVFKIHYQL
jgi:hypothetical protein